MPYDPIGIKESAPFRVSRSVLASDYLRISESFFRVDRSLVFPDRIDVKDGSILVKENTVLSSDALIYDSASYKGAVQVNAYDVFSDDSISYTKTYSPILFTMLAYRVRPRYLTLSINDVISTKDYVSYTKTYSPILFTMLAYRVRPRYLTLSISDLTLVKDNAAYIKAKVVLISDYKTAYDSVIPSKAAQINVLEKVIADSSYAKNKTLLVSDYKMVYDSVGYNKAKQVGVLDSLISDYVSYTKTYSPILFTMLAYRVRPRYLTLAMSDYSVVKDSGSYVKVKVVSVYDYKVVYDGIVVTKPKAVSVYDKIAYDYVPSMNPSNVHFMSIYPNPSSYGILVSDYGVFYDSATARRTYKTVLVSDVVGVKDGVSMKNRTVMVYDRLATDNAALNKV
jgi:hypothetical protein